MLAIAGYAQQDAQTAAGAGSVGDDLLGVAGDQAFVVAQVTDSGLQVHDAHGHFAASHIHSVYDGVAAAGAGGNQYIAFVKCAGNKTTGGIMPFFGVGRVTFVLFHVAGAALLEFCLKSVSCGKGFQFLFDGVRFAAAHTAGTLDQVDGGGVVFCKGFGYIDVQDLNLGSIGIGDIRNVFVKTVGNINTVYCDAAAGIRSGIKTQRNRHNDRLSSHNIFHLICREE